MQSIKNCTTVSYLARYLLYWTQDCESLRGKGGVDNTKFF
eukprot:COSAG05_NODE_638_length_8163_cov_16.318452_10_plen_40_part_00